MYFKKNLAVLCDYGLDDAVATIHILNNSDKFNKIDILPIGGNFPVEDSLVNAKRLLTHYEKNIENVRLVNTVGIPQGCEKLVFIHGKDGMGDILPLEYNDIDTIEYDSWIKEVDNNYVIVSLGPCTVAKDILKQKGALDLVMMGGNIAEEPNFNGYEFNHGMDIGAFEECVKYPHVVATLDSCHFDKGDLNKIEIRETGIFDKTLKRYRELSNERKESGCYVYDLVVAVYLTDPERFSCETATDKDGNILKVLKYIYNENIL